jgi:hypothetical protein
LHVPKSAGTSIHVSLAAALPPGAVSPKRQDTSLFCGGFGNVDLLDSGVRAMLAVDGDEVRELSDYAVVSGHFSLSTLLQITSRSSIATVLREPRSRVISHYAFWRLSSSARTAWPGYSAPDHALRPLNEFLAEPQVAQATDNLVCRMMLGADPRIPELDFISPSDVDELASLTVAALDTLGFVGILELGDAIWTGLSRFFEAPLIPMRLNTADAEGLTTRAPDAKLKITEHTVDLLRARTAVDRIVYEHALAGEGCVEDRAQRISATAFADELVRLGDVAGRSASELREQVRRKDAELRDHAELLCRARAELAAKDAELAAKDAELALHREWLDGMVGSASWRMTAPARVAKRALKKLRAEPLR